jgi:hypothetical protein
LRLTVMCLHHDSLACRVAVIALRRLSLLNAAFHIARPFRFVERYCNHAL